jgi:dTDP-4-amino-4,6-dideoxygalactose transaminase
MTKLVPVNSLQRHIHPIEDSLASAAADVIRSGHYVLGPGVAAFETEFAAYCGVQHCISVANGTDALELSLKAVGIVPGDSVAVTANAAMYGTSAVLACGGEPIFVDINLVDSTLDPQQLARLLESGMPIKAVIVTHLYGRLAAIEEIVSLCAKYDIRLIEDCAQAHGAARGGRKAGAFGDIASFSFYPTKNLGALGDGGAVVCRNEEIARRARQLRQYGWTKKYENGLRGGRNSRLDEIQARMLSLMLPLLDGWNDRRREIANRYSKEIRNAKIKVPDSAGSEYVAHLYVIRTDARDALKSHLDAHGIQTEIHYPTPDHRQPCHADRYADVHLSRTEDDCASVLTLPCFPELTDDEVERVVSACNAF